MHVLYRKCVPPRRSPPLHTISPINGMSEYWKSTPSYWCKFCSIYVKDTPIERRNHESSGKHQGSIQRSLRELHKTKAYEERDKQRARDEVARLNGLVGDKSPNGGVKISGVTDVTSRGNAAPTSRPVLSAAAQRRRHAEELAALGVELPDELKKEVTGVGSWQTVSERVIENPGSRSMADILLEEQDNKDALLNRGVHKRKMEGEEEDSRDEEAAPKKFKAWGSDFKSYPGAEAEEEDDGDLENLLKGVAKKMPEVKEEWKAEDPVAAVKLEEDVDAEKIPAALLDDITIVKTEAGEETVPPVIFKKRRGKR